MKTLSEFAFYRADIKKLVITDSVVNSATSSFLLCKIDDVTIPDSWTEIPDRAFFGSNIINFDIPKGITRIGRSAFRSSLENVTIPSTVTEIGERAFGGSKIKTVAITGNVTEVSKEAFRESGITSITLPDTVTSIGQRSFYMSRDLESVNIPASVRTIGEMALYDCESLQSVSLPPSVSRIDNGSFGICSCLDVITILNPNCVISDSPSTIFSYAETEKMSSVRSCMMKTEIVIYILF